MELLTEDIYEAFEIIPAPILSFESQANQYPRKGKPGVRYFAGDVSAIHPGLPPVNCLLWRCRDGLVRGILNHYPVDYGTIEKAGSINIFVHPKWKRRGIATALVRECEKRWGQIDEDAQRYSREGLEFMLKVRQVLH